MEIKVTVKQLGKKQPVLKEKKMEIDWDQSFISLKDLLELVVLDQVKQYNDKSIDLDDRDTIHTPSQEYFPILTETGKAGFGSVYNENKVDLRSAQENVIQCYEDGIIAVFQGEDEIISLSQDIDLRLNVPFTFIRLTFLAGSVW